MQDSPVALQPFSISEFTVSTNQWNDLIKMRFLMHAFYIESKGSKVPHFLVLLMCWSTGDGISGTVKKHSKENMGPSSELH